MKNKSKQKIKKAKQNLLRFTRNKNIYKKQNKTQRKTLYYEQEY